MSGRAALVAALFGAALAACTPPAPTPSGGCDDAAFQRIRAEQRSPWEVTVCGKVIRVPPARRTRSGTHEYFFVDIPGDGPIEIVSNENEMGGRIPVRVGDEALVRGRYYHDPNGTEGIDWTHHGTSARWRFSGYVVINGTKYQ